MCLVIVGRMPTRIISHIARRMAYIRTFSYLQAKQRGLCHYCRQAIVKDADSIVIKDGKPVKYYHMVCAGKIAII